MNPHLLSIRTVVETLEARRLLSGNLLKDIGAGELHANPSELTVVGTEVYFVASASAPGAQAGTYWDLWRTDGTPEGTVRIERFGGGASGSQFAWDSTDPGLAFYTGPRSLLAVGDELWYYSIRHSSSQILLVSINRIAADGETNTWDLGSMNLSLGQRPHDLLNVDGQVYFYRDGDEFSLDPALQRSTWWTIDESGEWISTGQRSTTAFKGAGPAYGNSALLRDKRLAVRDDPVHGRELFAEDNPSLSGGVLRVFGSDLDDDILISRRADKPSYLGVRINGFLTTFRFSSVKKIQVDLLRGDDRAIVSEADGRIAIPVSMFGGAGNDTLQGASARDTLYGGPGDDALYGGGERDHLFGEAGNDRLVGGGGSDILWGGPGQDAFVRSSTNERRDNRPEDLLA